MYNYKYFFWLSRDKSNYFMYSELLAIRLIYVYVCTYFFDGSRREAQDKGALVGLVAGRSPPEIVPGLMAPINGDGPRDGFDGPRDGFDGAGAWTVPMTGPNINPTVVIPRDSGFKDLILPPSYLYLPVLVRLMDEVSVLRLISAINLYKESGFSLSTRY